MVIGILKKVYFVLFRNRVEKGFLFLFLKRSHDLIIENKNKTYKRMCGIFFKNGIRN